MYTITSLISGILFLLFCLHLPVILFITYKIKNNFLRWFCVIYPVLFLCVLFFLPLDIGSSLVWILAFFCVVTLMVSLFVNIIRKLRHKEVPYLKMRFVRTFLAIIVFVLAVYAHKYSMDYADNYAIQKAKEVQAMVNQTGQCPLNIEGWPESWEDSGEYHSFISYGRIGPNFSVWYWTNAVEFKFQVKHNIDTIFVVEGGVNKKLNAYISGCSHTKEIPIGDQPQ